jgi:hypothetical protein
MAYKCRKGLVLVWIYTHHHVPFLGLLKLKIAHELAYRLAQGAVVEINNLDAGARAGDGTQVLEFDPLGVDVNTERVTPWFGRRQDAEIIVVQGETVGVTYLIHQAVLKVEKLLPGYFHPVNPIDGEMTDAFHSCNGYWFEGFGLEGFGLGCSPLADVSMVLGLREKTQNSKLKTQNSKL